MSPADVEPRTSSLTTLAWLDLIYSYLVDGRAAEVSREQMIDAVEKALGQDWLPRSSTWGTSPAAAQGQRAMMDLFGSPAL